MCGREMTSSSEWNSDTTTGHVAKKQPLRITGRESWLCRGGKWWRMWSIKSGLPSVVETRQLYLRLPFPTVEIKNCYSNNILCCLLNCFVQCSHNQNTSLTIAACMERRAQHFSNVQVVSSPSLNCNERNGLNLQCHIPHRFVKTPSKIELGVHRDIYMLPMVTCPKPNHTN